MDNRDNTTHQPTGGNRNSAARIETLLTRIPSTKLHPETSGLIATICTYLKPPAQPTNHQRRQPHYPRSAKRAALLAGAKCISGVSLVTRHRVSGFVLANPDVKMSLATDFSNRPIQKLESTPTHRKQTSPSRSNRPISRNSLPNRNRFLGGRTFRSDMKTAAPGSKINRYRCMNRIDSNSNLLNKTPVSNRNYLHISRAALNPGLTGGDPKYR